MSQISSDLPLDFRPWSNVTVLSDEMKELEIENKKIVKDYMKLWREHNQPCAISYEPEVPQLPPPSPPMASCVPYTLPEAETFEPPQAPLASLPPVPQPQGETKEEEPVVAPPKRKLKIKKRKKKKPVNNPEE